ncbi:MAG: tetratricopeptide repeat protein [Bacteroidetes bacterium]|nr:tetratricopeptide repeat protein [Bacteroidota bacterium]MBS1541784.1 tetratricopeptide repeat protein [Bacteroidota bacterium]
MKKLLLVFVLLSSLKLYGQEKTFVREYTYKASEADSKVSCRAIAMNELRTELLNELGVYVESNDLLTSHDDKGKFSQDFKEKISTITAGITKLDVLDEKWDGETFWMKASIKVDTTSLKESLKRISEDHQKMRELEEMKQRLTDANQKLAALSRQLQQQKEEDAKASIAEKYKAQVNTISATNYLYNAKSKYEAKDFAGAIVDFDKVISLDPKFALAYAYRGHAKEKLGSYPSAIEDFSKAIDLNPNFEVAYVDRGLARLYSHDYPHAVADFSQAIRINPSYALAYGGRGEAMLKMKDYAGALNDFDAAIRLDSQYALAYFGRGIARQATGKKGACADWQHSAQLGNREAYDFLQKHCR